MGRQYRSTNYFSPNDSNTIDDVTGFKRKLSEMKRRWEGFMTDEGWHPRQPQDFPVVPTAQKVYPNARTEQVEAEGTVPTFPII
jgi:hypothetical protein